VSDAASGSCAECIKALPVHPWLEKRRAKGGSQKENSCTSSCHKGILFVVIFLFLFNFVYVCLHFYFPLQAAYRFKEAARVNVQPKETTGTLSLVTSHLLLVSFVLLHMITLRVWGTSCIPSKQTMLCRSTVANKYYAWFDTGNTNSDAAPHVDGALGFGIKEEQLTALTRDHNYSALQQYGGVS
jgi:hypothetical protein